MENKKISKCKFVWLMNRLKAMSFKEVLYRIRNKILHSYYKQKYKKGICINNILDSEINLEDIYNKLDIIFEEINYKEIDENNIYSFYCENISILNEIQWNKGTEGKWNNNISSYDIEFKNSDSIGDIRYSWEINRHQFLPYMAAMYLKSNDKKYLDILESHFYKWSDENKFLHGINWSSSMEIALRAYQWLIVIYLLKDTDAEKFKKDLVRSIIVSIEYVMKNLSLYSSANNHLIVEAAIGSICGFCLDKVVKQNWLKDGYRILNSEIKKQFHIDGVNKEQALHYQAFVIDMMLQYNYVLKKMGYNPVEEKLIRKSVEFIAQLNANKVNIEFGDSDDGKIIRFSLGKYNYYEYILCFAGAYYSVDYLHDTKKYAEVDLYIKTDRNTLTQWKPSNVKLYEYGGYLNINNDKSNILFDFGELGFGSLAAHGHADSLMINYYSKGKPFFVDSGTYIYNVQADRRNYYRGTSAHNTLCYKEKNQSEIRGPFLWGKKAESKLIEFKESDEGVTIEAYHNGYYPYIHKRKLKYISNTNNLFIYDYFDDQAKLNLNLDSNVKIKKINDDIYQLENEETIYLYIEGTSKVISTFISNEFTVEKESKKIEIDYEFKKEHLMIISDDLTKIEGYIARGVL